MMIEYVAGLYCTYDKRLNLLLKKNKPGHWQHDKFNLYGGHIEAGETPQAAMIREFKEETGYRTVLGQWKHCITLMGPGWIVYFFIMDGPSFAIIDSDEGVGSWHGDVPKSAIPNLHWIIPLMKDQTVIFPVTIKDSR